MIGKDDVQSRPVAIAETLEILEGRKKGGELGYEQQLAYDHAKKYASLSSEKAKKLAEELADFGLGEKTIVKIVDILPITEAQLKNVLLIEKKPVEDETVKKILEILKKYKSK